MNDQETFAPTQTTGTQKRHAPTVLESDGVDSDVPVVKTTRKATRKSPQSKGRTAAKKLFLDSDEEGSAPDTEPQGAVGKSHAGKMESVTVPARGSKRRHIIVDDDSDDGVAFKGFGKKKRVR